MNDAARAVNPPDPERIQAGAGLWQRSPWRGLAQGAVRPVGVGEVLVLPQHHHQVKLVPDQGPARSSRRPLPVHRSLIEFIRGAGTAERMIRIPAAWNTAPGRWRDAGVPVLPDELRSRCGLPQAHQQVPGVLDTPGPGRVLRGAQDPSAPAAVPGHRKGVHLRASEQVSGEKGPAPGSPAPGIAGTPPTQGRPGAEPGRSRRPCGSATPLGAPRHVPAPAIRHRLTSAGPRPRPPRS